VHLEARAVIRVADVERELHWWTRPMTFSDSRATRSRVRRGPLQLGALVLGIGLLAALPTVGIVAATFYVRVWLGLASGDATWNDGDVGFAIAGVAAGGVLLVVLVLGAVSICRRYRLRAWAWLPAAVLTAACVSIVPLLLFTA
jgi:hypothetical protein